MTCTEKPWMILQDTLLGGLFNSSQYGGIVKGVKSRVKEVKIVASKKMKMVLIPTKCLELCHSLDHYFLDIKID